MSKIQKMCEYIKDAASDTTCGYSQINRWRNPDVDCSSLMYLAANAAGYDIKIGSGYTGTMLADFTAAGFTAWAFDGNLYDLDDCDILLNVQNHTEIFIGGLFWGARIDENGNFIGELSGDQAGNEVCSCNPYNYPWDYVLSPPTGEHSEYPKISNDIEVELTPNYMVRDLAQAIINGDFGNGQDRIYNLLAKGYTIEQVEYAQNDVDNILANSIGSQMDILAAREVIKGTWGNGQARIDALTNAGYDASKIQTLVNQMLEN